VKKKRLPFTSPENFLNRLTVTLASAPPVVLLVLFPRE
jgi:hypothetical protein